MNIVKRKIAAAFSLIEMMIVLTVVGILLAFAAPDLFSLMQSSSLTSEGSHLRNQISQAQQLALAKNADVELRFFKLADTAAAETEEGFRAYQMFQFDKTGAMIEVSRFYRINAPVILSEALSTLLTTAGKDSADKKFGFVSPQEGKYEVPVGLGMEETDYVAFRFRPDGSTDLPNRSNGDTWYLTLVQGEGAVRDTDPANYYCLQVNPYNGQITEFRP
ncbi:Verru_Chthon cassette protein D [Verrucomicrobiales bacterium]|mgnify:CR=1 FL=1|nr:Verru_Chthon cassette protein D [Verrucomicrobiales bacterium]MDC0276066.1 Verru_Chthon cassette protein D [Verrucomicrobiales bacterium]MDC0322352.1 Verru_Chthon cassette protein D [Verrucomicrobiales bacterium]